MRKEVITHQDPKSPISEIFKTLRTNIQFMSTKGKLKTILVTSTLPGEGKSWVSSNLAVTFAQAGKRVVLIDADMRKGRQYTIFGVSPRPGLSNYLSGIIDNEEASDDLTNYIQETEIDNLYLISAGNIPPNPSELLIAPQTIDNDIWGTDVTFGFDSAVKVATETMDNIKTTASSHGRIFVVEVMGHKTGWVTLYSGIATGADIILIPEIPYDINKITSYIEKSDKKYLVIAAAEGIVEKEFSSLKNKERRKLLSEKNLKSQVEKLALDIQTATDKEVRITIPGHTQRGGSPTARDRIVSMQTGTATALNIINKNYGVMAAVINGRIVNVPLKEVAGKLKVVPADAEIILQAKEMGICFGD